MSNPPSYTCYNTCPCHTPSQPNSEERKCEHAGGCYRKGIISESFPFGYCRHSPKPEEEQIFTEEDFIKAEDFTHTSDEWEKEFEEFCSEFNESKVFDIKYTLKSFISSLLSQSEQRVRKEIVEAIMKIPHATRDEVYNEEEFLLCRDDIINLISK